MAVSTKTLHILGEKKPIAFRTNQNLLEVLNANKLSINQACGANGSCTTCRVIVHSGSSNLTPRSEIESERAAERQFSDSERLACQTFLLGDGANGGVVAAIAEGCSALDIVIEIPQFT